MVVFSGLFWGFPFWKHTTIWRTLWLLSLSGKFCSLKQMIFSSICAVTLCAYSKVKQCYMPLVFDEIKKIKYCQMLTIT